MSEADSIWPAGSTARRRPAAQAVSLPPGVLALELKFLCRECGTKLIIDARWQGRRLNCPHCGASAVVPECPGILRVPDEVDRDEAAAVRPPVVSQLTPAEIAFLSDETGGAARTDVTP